MKVDADEAASALERVYESGYADGESSVSADWLAALEDVLPDGVEVRPSEVAKYIADLQAP